MSNRLPDEEVNPATQRIIKVTQMPEVKLSGHILIPESDLAAVEAALPEHIELTRREAGCLEFNVFRDVDSKNVYHVSERFDSPEAFALHQDRVRCSPWGKVTANVQRHYTILGLDD